MGRQRFFPLAVLLLCVAAVGVEGQTFRGAINGTVTDPSGAVIADAKVTATEVATNIAHSSNTTSGGEFAFQDLPLGDYTVAVTANGFQPSTFSNVTVTAGGVYTLPVKLTVGSRPRRSR